MLQCNSSFGDKHLHYDTNSILCQALGSYIRKDAALPLSSKYNQSQKKIISLLPNACFISNSSS